MIHRLRLFRALRHKPIFILWSGEAFSAVGDEIYKVALIWLTVKLIGADAGYLAACQAGAVLLFGLVGGLWADSWDPRRTMFATDLLRAAVVLLPVAWMQFGDLNLPLLFSMAIAVAALNAFFEPALQAVVPRLVADRALLQATNGLMGTTNRMARAVGPAMVGVLTGLIPTIHFFTLDSLSFGVSALAIGRLKRDLPPFTGLGKKNTGVLKEVLSGLEIAREDVRVKYILWSKAVTSGAWNLVLPLGIAMLVQKNFPGDVRAYGFLLASYGVGNVISAVILSNIDMIRPMRMIGIGYFILGIGFVGFAVVPMLALKSAFLAFAAIGGPMNDLAHIDVFQHKYVPQQMVRVVRFRMAIEYGGMCLCLLVAPALFRLFSPELVVSLAGVVQVTVGAWGWVRFGE